jgi:hypothetical protein
MEFALAGSYTLDKKAGFCQKGSPDPYFQVKNPGPKDVALIDPRGVLKCLCNPASSGINSFLEYWSIGVME